MQPIVPITAAPRRAREATATRPLDLAVFGLAALSALTAFGLSCYFFAGFAQNDQGVWTLASSAALCFGVGGLAFGPLAVVARLALSAARAPLGQSRALLALGLMLPWAVLGFVLIFHSNMPLKYGWLVLMIAAVLSLWAALHALAARRKT